MQRPLIAASSAEGGPTDDRVVYNFANRKVKGRRSSGEGGGYARLAVIKTRLPSRGWLTKGKRDVG